MESMGYLRVLRRRAGLIATAAAAGLLIAVVLAVAIPSSFSATATLFLRVSAQSTSLYARSQFAVQRVQSYPELMGSPGLLATIKSDLGLPQSTAQIAKQIAVVNPTETALLNVTATSSTPAAAAALANEAATVLAARVNAIENTQVLSKNAVTLTQEVTATRPEAPSAPNRPLILLVGLLAGLVIGYLVALLLEAVRPRLHDAADVREAVELPLVALLPRASTKEGARLEATPAVTSAAANLRAIGRGVVPPIILLTPVDPRSVRPLTRYQLATGVVETGRKVVVVETARSRRLPAGVDAPHEAPGIATPGVDPALIVRAAAAGPVDVVPAGDGATSFDLQHTFRAKLETIAGAYDTTLLESVSADKPVDLETVAPAAGAAFLVVTRGRTSRDAARLALTRLRVLGVVPIGVVMVDGGRRNQDLVQTWREEDYIVVAPRAESAVASPAPASGSDLPAPASAER